MVDMPDVRPGGPDEAHALAVTVAFRRIRVGGPNDTNSEWFSFDLADDFVLDISLDGQQQFEIAIEDKFSHTLAVCGPVPAGQPLLYSRSMPKGTYFLKVQPYAAGPPYNFTLEVTKRPI